MVHAEPPEDCSTIDWGREYAKERARVLAVKQRRGIRGARAKLWDGAVTWIVIAVSRQHPHVNRYDSSLTSAAAGLAIFVLRVRPGYRSVHGVARGLPRCAHALAEVSWKQVTIAITASTATDRADRTCASLPF